MPRRRWPHTPLLLRQALLVMSRRHVTLRRHDIDDYEDVR